MPLLMPQFIARVFREKSGYRVHVDSLVDLYVEKEEEIEVKTREAIIDLLRASHPRRREPEPYPEVIRTLGFDIELVEAMPSWTRGTRLWPRVSIGSEVRQHGRSVS